MAARTTEPSDELTARYRARLRRHGRRGECPCDWKASVPRKGLWLKRFRRALVCGERAAEGPARHRNGVAAVPEPVAASRAGCGRRHTPTTACGLPADGCARMTCRARKSILQLNDRQSNQNLGTLAMRIRRAPGEIRRRIEEVNSSLARSEFDRGRFLRSTFATPSIRTSPNSLRQSHVCKTDRCLPTTARPKSSGSSRYGNCSAVSVRRIPATLPGAIAAWTPVAMSRSLASKSTRTETLSTITTHPTPCLAGRRRSWCSSRLAAALRYQLVGPDGDLPKYGTVILDEAFDRSDPEYTRRAADVFDQFGFDLVLATPLKMIRTLQEYVGGVATVSIRDSKASRLGVASISEAADA